MENNCCEWKLKTVDPQGRNTLRSDMRSAVRAAKLMWMMPLHLHVNHIIMEIMMKFNDIYNFCECMITSKRTAIECVNKIGRTKVESSANIRTRMS